MHLRGYQLMMPASCFALAFARGRGTDGWLQFPLALLGLIWVSYRLWKSALSWSTRLAMAAARRASSQPSAARTFAMIAWNATRLGCVVWPVRAVAAALCVFLADGAQPG
jgi:hypothetical protein